MASRFLNFPVEVLLFIFSSLTPRELLACRNSCRRLRDIIRGDGLLQWRLQSLEYCMDDFLPLGSLTSDFLKNLEEIGMASSTLCAGEEVSKHSEFERFRGFHEFAFFGDTETNFLLRSGYLIQVRKGKDPGWAYMELSPKNNLQRYTPDLEWRGVHLKGNGIVGWALDVDQDLMAVSLLP